MEGGRRRRQRGGGRKGSEGRVVRLDGGGMGGIMMCESRRKGSRGVSWLTSAVQCIQRALIDFLLCWCSMEK